MQCPHTHLQFLKNENICTTFFNNRAFFSRTCSSIIGVSRIFSDIVSAPGFEIGSEINKSYFEGSVANFNDLTSGSVRSYLQTVLFTWPQDYFRTFFFLHFYRAYRCGYRKKIRVLCILVAFQISGFSISFFLFLLVTQNFT